MDAWKSAHFSSSDIFNHSLSERVLSFGNSYSQPVFLGSWRFFIFPLTHALIFHHIQHTNPPPTLSSLNICAWTVVQLFPSITIDILTTQIQQIQQNWMELILPVSDVFSSSNQHYLLNFPTGTLPLILSLVFHIKSFSLTNYTHTFRITLSRSTVNTKQPSVSSFSPSNPSSNCIWRVFQFIFWVTFFFITLLK